MATAQIAPVAMAFEIPGTASCSRSQRAIRDAVMMSNEFGSQLCAFCPSNDLSEGGRCWFALSRRGAILLDRQAQQFSAARHER